MCMSLCLPACRYMFAHVFVYTQGGQKMVLDGQELELQGVVSCLMWELATKPGSGTFN